MIELALLMVVLLISVRGAFCWANRTRDLCDDEIVKVQTVRPEQTQSDPGISEAVFYFR